MGNDWKPRFDSSSSSPSSTRPSSPGITKSTSNEGTHLGTGSAFSGRLDEVSPNGQILPMTPTLKIFRFAELKKATSKFSPDTFLGEGAFGKVFKGWIDEKTFATTKAGSGMAIAVKKLDADSFHLRKGWQTEVDILGSLSHPNIVRLLGHCEEDKELLLVYEFMPRGSLENHLFSKTTRAAAVESARIAEMERAQRIALQEEVVQMRTQLNQLMTWMQSFTGSGPSSSSSVPISGAATNDIQRDGPV